MRAGATLPSPVEDLEITPALIIPASELSWTAVRASGPGGQNVNKVSTKVELCFDLPASAVLGEDVKARLRALVGRRLDASGRVIVVSQAGRTQSRNLDLARARLAALVRAALVPPRARRATRPTASSRARRLTSKRRTSEKKARRGAVRSED